MWKTLWKQLNISSKSWNMLFFVYFIWRFIIFRIPCKITSQKCRKWQFRDSRFQKKISGSMPRTPLDVSCAFITQFVTPAPPPAPQRPPPSPSSLTLASPLNPSCFKLSSRLIWKKQGEKTKQTVTRFYSLCLSWYWL